MLPSQSKPWLKTIGKETFEYVLPKMTIYSYLKERASTRLDEVAIDYYGYRLTNRELLQRIDQVADAYASWGIKKGDHVSFLTVAFVETICSMYALSKIGAVCNFIDPRMDILRIRDFIKLMDSKMLVVVDMAFPKVRDTIKDLNLPLTVVQSPAESLPLLKKIGYGLKNKKKAIPYSSSVIRWSQFFSKRMIGEAVEAPYVPDTTVVVTQTGGTTGAPKGVELTNDGLNALAVCFVEDGILKTGGNFMDIMPIFTSYGIGCGTHAPLCIGLKLNLVPDFKPDRFPKLIAEYKPNITIAVPAFYEKIMYAKETKDIDYSFVKAWASGGDTTNLSLETKLDEFLSERGSKYPVAQGYGMSEASSCATFCWEGCVKPLSSGLPAPTITVGIFEPGTDNELDVGQTGEICMSGPTLMKGYFKNPEETAKVKITHSDGTVWLHSGDIGYMDQEGYLFVKGRIKRMITRFDGHKIFPGQLETVVSGYPGVANCAVIAVTDMDHGQGKYPMCVVEMADANIDKVATRQELIKLCDERLEERGKPCTVIIIDKIPLTSFGKNDILALEADYGNYNYKED